MCDDDLWIRFDQLDGKLIKPLVGSLAPTRFDDHIAPFHVTSQPHPLAKGREHRGVPNTAVVGDPANAYGLRPLGFGGQRQSCEHHK